ncbi:hypothetical protein AGMMS49925_02020 [Deltaproteobacteria bacterium]|nr:hypothetical protein AGMMS49925_02020 [Deltaproteobacteria bacterium]
MAVDKWQLYAIGKYCDEMIPDGSGGEEKRFTFNGVINSREEAYKVLTLLCGTFRGMIYFGMGSVIAVQDSPRSERIQRILDSGEAGLYMPWQDLRRTLTAGRFAGNACAGWTAATTANPVRSERKQRQQMLPGVRPVTATGFLLRSDICCQNSNSIVNCPTIKRSL